MPSLSSPDSTRLITVTAVKPLVALAIGNLVDVVLAIWCRRSAQPKASAYATPGASTRTTPENPVSCAFAATARLMEVIPRL